MTHCHPSSLPAQVSSVLSVLFSVATLLIYIPNGALAADEQVSNTWSRPVRVAKLLWQANPEAAAKTLRQAIQSALSRNQTDEARAALLPVAPLAAAVLEQGDANDPRFAVALAIETLLDANQPQQRLASRMQTIADLSARTLVLEAWLATASLVIGESQQITETQQPNYAMQLLYLRQTLNDAASEPEWAGRVAASLLGASPNDAAAAVLNAWPSLPDELRVTLVEPLTSRAETMRELVDGVAEGRVPRDLLNPNQLRKWASHDVLGPLIEAQWGTIRDVDSAARQQVVADVLKRVGSGATASYGRGEVVFGRVCSQCHRFRGQGFEVGPDITANGRGNLEQLASNIFDPSLVIGPAFQSQTVLTADGEVLSGIVVADTPQYLTLKLQGGQTIELNKNDDIESLKKADKSLMPEGLEQQLQPQELLDLLAYLALVKPLGEPDNELIAGAPEDFVEP